MGGEAKLDKRGFWGLAAAALLTFAFATDAPWYWQMLFTTWGVICIREFCATPTQNNPEDSSQ